MMTTILIWSIRLLAVAIFFQTRELLNLRNIWSDQGIWRWSVLRREHEHLPSWMRKTFDALLPEEPFHLLLKARIFCCFAVWIYPASLLVGVLFFSTWLIAIRWRGIFNGGSDSMTALIALAVWIGQSFSNHDWIVKAALGYIAVHVTGSYFLAGLVKVKNQEWRDGRALPLFFEIPRYDSPPEWMKRGMKNSFHAKIISWSIIIFECSFPLAWISPGICMIYLGTGLVFHLLNFQIFGLNRFVFAWLAGYPALYFWSHH